MCYPIWIAPFRRLCGKTAQPVCHDRIPVRGQLQTHVRVDFVVSLESVGRVWYIFVRRFDRTAVRAGRFDSSADGPISARPEGRAMEVEMGETAVVSRSAAVDISRCGSRRRGIPLVVPDGVAAARTVPASVLHPARERFAPRQRGHLRVVPDSPNRAPRAWAPAVYTDPWPESLPGSWGGDGRGPAERGFVPPASRVVADHVVAERAGAVSARAACAGAERAGAVSVRAARAGAEGAGAERAAEQAVPTVRRASRRPPVRLTRRGRVVVLGVVLALSATLVALLASTGNAAAPASPRSVVVHQGDTLWSIASRIHPHGSLTATMLEIERLNHMSDGTVYVGQQLIVPAS